MNEPPAKTLDRTLALALKSWVAVTALFIVANCVAVVLGGVGLFSRLVQEGPCSQTWLTMATVAIVWVAFGGVIVALRPQRFRSRHGLTIVCTFITVVLYTNILRERPYYGDVRDYVWAAGNLVGGEPLHSRYLYPPFWATVLTPFVHLGPGAVGAACWGANIVSLCLLVVLLTAVLVRYGFGARVSPVVAFAFLVVNVPVLRTLGYAQVNLHVVDLILVSLLAYPCLRAISAIALALAVHMKASPLVLALPFVAERDWRWTVCFVVALAGIACVTVIPYGPEPFLDFVHNVRHIYEANGIEFRETSIDSFFRSLAVLLGWPLGSMYWPITAAKALVTALSLLVVLRVMKNRSFSGERGPGSLVYNGVPVLLLPVLLVSPLIWEHHPVLVALPYLLLLKRLASPGEWTVYAFAYFLQFVMPTFDFFPWSFARLLSLLAILWLIHATAGRPEDGPLLPALSRLLGAGGHRA